MPESIDDAYKWATENLKEWFDSQDKLKRKHISIATLDEYMFDLLGVHYQEVWYYFDIYKYTVEGVDNRIIIMDNDTKEFTIVNEYMIPRDEDNVNEWIIDYHGRGHTVFVIIRP